MATADDYAAWIVKNADKRGTPEFDTVAAAYKDAKGTAPAAAPAPAAPAASKDLAFGDAPLVMGVSPNGARAALAGVGKGAGQVALGAQDLLGRGIGALGGKTLGDWLRTDAAAGQKKLEGELAPYKASNPVAAGAGELVGQGVATLPVGGMLAAPIKLAARAAPVLAPIADAVATGGFRAAGARGVGGMAARMAGGAATGGATMELIDPEHAVSGALIGAALPPAMRVAGAVARPVGNAIARAAQPAEMSAADDIARALDASTPAQLSDLVAKLRSGEKLVTTPTAAQAIQSPAASILQRVVHDTPGGAALRNKIANQAEERLNALEKVAATNPTGYAEAADSLGRSVTKQAIPAEAEAGRRVNALYEAVDPFGETRLNLPIDNMQAARDKFLGRGTFGSGKAADDALSTARAIGTESSAVKFSHETTGASHGQIDSSVTATRNGAPVGRLDYAVVDGVPHINMVEVPPGLQRQGIGAELARELQRKFPGQEINWGSMTPDGAALRKSLPATTRPIPEVQSKADALKAAINERDARLAALETPTARPTADDFDAINALHDKVAALENELMRGGPASRTLLSTEPLAARQVAKPVTFREVQNLRSSIGEAADKAGAEGRNREAAALAKMRDEIDQRVNAAAAGKGDPAEFFPADIVATWREANAAHAAKMDRFHTGPQAGLFRKGGDGLPALQGGEVASAFWGNRPGLADDVRSFKRLVDDSPELLGQFKSLVTTHGASTADAAGNLTTKFSKWVDNTLPGLREAFSPDEVATLQRIAKDIDRAAVANKLGTSLGGSNTYQNAANALDLGLLDSPALTKAAGMVPGVRMIAGPALEGLRNAARNTKATRMAELLADSDVSANALEKLLRARSPKSNALAQAAGASVYRSAPRNGSGSP